MIKKEHAIEAIRNSDVYRRYREAEADVTLFKKRSTERDQSIKETRDDIRKLDELRVTEEEAYKQVVGTRDEAESLQRIERTKAELENKRKRLGTLQDLKINGNGRQRMEALDDKSRTLWHRSMALVVENEMKDFPDEARKVLIRAYAVAVRTNWLNWEQVLNDTLGLNRMRDEDLRHIGNEVLHEYFPEDR